jgi:hypothetical protein
MDINTLRKWIAERDTYSILEMVDVHTGERTVGKSCAAAVGVGARSRPI